MKYTISTNFLDQDSPQQYDEGLFKLKAEEDYIIARYLSLVGFNYSSHSLFHLQQCMEKYFKAFLIRSHDERKFDTQHNLEKLAGWCSKYDYAFFNDKELLEACAVISPFAELGRYQAKPPDEKHPESKKSAYSREIPASLNFFDEFVYEMRKKFPRRRPEENIADAIKALYDLSWHPFKGAISTPMLEAFKWENPYVSLIESQF